MIRVITKAHIVAFSILIMGLFQPHHSQAVVLEDPADQLLATFLEEQEVQCLAKNIYYESRGEPKEGKVAVGIVTLNRVSNPSYPNDICSVVHQRTQNRAGKSVCQFNWTCTKPRLPKETDPLWVESVKIATKLLLGNYKEWMEKYNKSHHFHSVDVNPKWNLRRVALIGRHIFYH